MPIIDEVLHAILADDPGQTFLSAEGARGCRRRLRSTARPRNSVPYKNMARRLVTVYDAPMAKARFEWNAAKDRENRRKHGVGFAHAQFAFADPRRVIAIDTVHGGGEERYFCIGNAGEGILTVRFTWREGVIRIFGAGYWRKGKRIYERENQIHR